MDLAGMPGPRRLRGLTLVVFWCLALSGWSQNTPAPSLTYTKTQFQWGVLPLEDRGLEPAFRSLAEDLMIRLSHGWKNLPDRELTVDDLQKLQKEAWEARVRQEEKSLTEALNARDQLLFKPGGASPEDYAKADQKILALQESLESWKTLDPQTLSGPVSAPLKQVSESSEKILLLPPAGGFSQWMKSKSLDLVAGGAVRSVRGYIQAEFHIWDQDRKSLAEWSGWFSPDDAENLLGEIRGKLTPGILGRQTASLEIKADPPQTRIYLDGVMKGVGVVELPFWEPGDYILKLEGDGLAARGETVSLASGDSLILERKLEALEGNSVLLTTGPEGADVYLDSLWIGRSPLEVPLSTGRSLALFMLPDYEEGSLSLVPQASGTQEVSLALRGTRPSIRDSKDRFYLSLGVFSFSFAATALVRALEGPLTQIYNQAGQAYIQGTLDRERLNQYYTFQQAAVNGGTAGTALTGALFAWLLWELYGYITSGEVAQYN